MLEDVLPENTGISGIRKSRTGYHVNEKAPNFGAFFMRGSYSGSYAFTFTLFNTVEKSEILQKSRLKNMQ